MDNRYFSYPQAISALLQSIEESVVRLDKRGKIKIIEAQESFGVCSGSVLFVKEFFILKMIPELQRNSMMMGRGTKNRSNRFIR